MADYLFYDVLDFRSMHHVHDFIDPFGGHWNSSERAKLQDAKDQHLRQGLPE